MSAAKNMGGGGPSVPKHLGSIVALCTMRAQIQQKRLRTELEGVRVPELQKILVPTFLLPEHSVCRQTQKC